MKKKKQYITHIPNSGQQGFTLVEFMVASVLGLVVIAGAGALYSYTKRLNDMGMARVAMLQDLRSAATMIAQDSRTAGVFGCASLGRRWAPDSTDCSVALENADASAVTGGAVALNGIIQLQTLSDDTGVPAEKRSAGVRWFEASKVNSDLGKIWDGIGFTPDADSGALLFYYGEGSLSFNSSDSTGVAFNTEEPTPNKTVTNVLNTKEGGWLVAAGCNTLAFQHSSKGIKSGNTLKITNVPAGGTTTASTAGPSAIVPNSDMILQRYKIVAYVVGNIPNVDDPTSSSLYRFEFGANGNNWSAPQQLAKNVTKMEAEYLFVTDCPAAMEKTSVGTPTPVKVDVNTQKFTVKNADEGNAVSDDKTVSPDWGKAGAAQGPSSIRLTLTYNFPKIRGGSVATGNVDDDGKPIDETFNITAVVRGGNVCASRKIVPF